MLKQLLHKKIQNAKTKVTLYLVSRKLMLQQY